VLTLLLDTIQAQTEDFEVTTGGGSAARIRTLERGLKEERRRLANMEQELRAAKKKKESQVEYSFLKRHSSALDAAVARLGEQAERDARTKEEWAREWDLNLRKLQQRHKDSETALQQRQARSLPPPSLLRVRVSAAWARPGPGNYGAGAPSGGGPRRTEPEPLPSPTPGEGAEAPAGPPPPFLY